MEVDCIDDYIYMEVDCIVDCLHCNDGIRPSLIMGPNKKFELWTFVSVEFSLNSLVVLFLKNILPIQ